jgi:hypothetical protein
VIGGRVSNKFGVERFGVGGRLAGESLRICELIGIRPDCERLRVRGREAGTGGGNGGTAFASSE